LIMTSPAASVGVWGGSIGHRALGRISFLSDRGAVVDTSVQGASTHTWYLLSAVGTVTAIVDQAPGPIENGQFVYLP
jgi:hypothetical protein